MNGLQTSLRLLWEVQKTVKLGSTWQKEGEQQAASWTRVWKKATPIKNCVFQRQQVQCSDTKHNGASNSENWPFCPLSNWVAPALTKFTHELLVKFQNQGGQNCSVGFCEAKLADGLEKWCHILLWMVSQLMTEICRNGTQLMLVLLLFPTELRHTGQNVQFCDIFKITSRKKLIHGKYVFIV